MCHVLVHGLGTNDIVVSINEGPPNGWFIWFIMENHIEVDDLGVALFQETPARAMELLQHIHHVIHGLLQCGLCMLLRVGQGYLARRSGHQQKLGDRHLPDNS